LAKNNWKEARMLGHRLHCFKALAVGAMLLCFAILGQASESALPQLITTRSARSTDLKTGFVPTPVYPRSERVSVNVALLESLREKIEKGSEGNFPRINVRPFDDVNLLVELREIHIDSKEIDRIGYFGHVLEGRCPIPSCRFELVAEMIMRPVLIGLRSSAWR
jgi:hypothetical protein